MRLSLLSFALFCVIVPSLHAQLEATDPPYQAICRGAFAKPFTPPTSNPALKPDCDASAAYFGIGRAVDYAEARSCAFIERAQPEAASTNNIFYGAGVLSMIYANGQGVPVDLDMATRFTCEKWASPAEIETRLDILTADRESHTVAPFDLCDTATSGNALGWCTSIQARLSTLDRNQRFDQWRATLPAAAAPLLADLQKAEDEFLGLHTQNELEPNGTLPNAAQLIDENDLRDEFLADLMVVTSPTFHQETALKAADKRLTEAFKPVRNGAAKTKIPRAPKTLPGTAISFKGVENTQQAWLHLRDSWMAFTRSAGTVPNADAQAGALVTLERVRQLDQLTHPPVKE